MNTLINLWIYCIIGCCGGLLLWQSIKLYQTNCRLRKEEEKNNYERCNLQLLRKNLDEEIAEVNRYSKWLHRKKHVKCYSSYNKYKERRKLRNYTEYAYSTLYADGVPILRSLQQAPKMSTKDLLYLSHMDRMSMTLASQRDWIQSNCRSSMSGGWCNSDIWL